MSEKLVQGIIPAIPTPISEGRVSQCDVERVVEHAFEAGCSGLYVTGRTGRVGELTLAQRRQMIDATSGIGDSEKPVIVQVGGTTLEDAMSLAKYAEKAGAQAISSMAPCDATDLRAATEHYAKIGGATDLPFLVYWISGQTENVSAEQFLKSMRRVPNFAGMKYTDPDFKKLQDFIQRSEEDKLTILTGPDEKMLDGLKIGSDGAIGATVNIMPRLYSQMYADFHKGNIAAAEQAQAEAAAVIDVLVGNTMVVSGIMNILHEKKVLAGPLQPQDKLPSAQQAALMNMMRDYELS